MRYVENARVSKSVLIDFENSLLINKLNLKVLGTVRWRCVYSKQDASVTFYSMLKALLRYARPESPKIMTPRSLGPRCCAYSFAA